MDTKEKKGLIKKAHELVEARYHFSIWEARVFAKMVSMIRKDDLDFQMYRIEVKGLINFFDARSKDVYSRIKKVPKSLMSKVISIPYIANDGEERVLIAPLLSSATIPKETRGASYIEVCFDPKLKPYLLQLKERFLMYDIRNILSLTSPHSVRIYEFLKQYEKIGVREISVTLLKQSLGVEGKYKRYNDFKKKVILHAQKNLVENTDISFSFQEIKRGRKINSIKFFISKNIPLRKDEKGTNEVSHIAISSNSTYQELCEELHPQISQYMSVEGLVKLLEKYPEQQVRTAIQLTLNRIENGDKIKNPAGHIIKMATQPSLFDHIEQGKKVKQKKVEKAKQKKALKLQKEQLEQQLKELEATKIEAMKEVSKKLFKNDALRVEVIEELKQATYLRKWIDDVEKLEDAHPIAQAAIVRKLAEKQPKYFVEIGKEYDAEIAELKKKVR